MNATLSAIKFRFTLFFILFVTALISVIVLTSIRQTLQATSIMVSIAGIPALERAATFIDGNKYEQLVQTLDPFDSFYIETQKKFQELKKETNCRYLYTMAPYNDKIHLFIFDGEDQDSADFSPLGTEENITDYEKAYSKTSEIKTANFTPMMYSTRWGYLISAYMPILNSNDDVVGIIGIDFDGKNVFDTIVSNIIVQIIFAAIFIIIGLFIYFLLFKGLAQQNDELLKMRQHAENASQAKSGFLAMISHEIRTPLNAIIGIAQIQMQKKDLSGDSANALKKIFSSGNNLLGLINDILDMSKIETGKLELNPVVYDMPSLINDTMQINVVRIGAKPIKFDLDIDKNLPTKIYGDDLRLKQILNNLLSNAIKYTQKGHVKLSLKHWTHGEDITLHFTVEDTGQGIKPEDRNQLFSEFLRFNNTANRMTEGTGLGLSITRKLVEMMGGSIMVESEYGKGSIFTVTVKQKVVECPAIGAELAKQLINFMFTSNRLSDEMQIHRDPMPYGKVLIVDDVQTNLFVAEGLLEQYKLKIETATNGFTVIDKIKAGNTYDVIFMDHMMPSMDGIQTTKELRNLGYTGIIVALTANAIVGNEKMFAQNGFSGFISKPINVQQLNNILNKFIRDRHPDEAKIYSHDIILQNQNIDKNTKLLQFFSNEAKTAIATLQETLYQKDIKLFTITAHAMKSALANIGESEASKLAAKLENAGLNNEMEYIITNTPDFIRILTNIIETNAQQNPTNFVDDSIAENTAYLTEQLQLVSTACEDYDDDAAFAILKNLLEKKWQIKTADELKQIHDILFVYSDFEEAAKRSNALIKEALRL